MNHAHEAAPSTLENLLLDIGGGTGALAIYATESHAGREVEISQESEPGHRTHNIVRPRQTPSGTVYAAVFPALPAGDYVVWHDASTRAGTITIRGGQVTQFRLPGLG
jgi:hypothetical protein